MNNEEIISDFLRTAYTDEKLAQLLAHAEDGKLSYFSCCCFIGIPTADHALRGISFDHSAPVSMELHYQDAELLPGAYAAELAFNALGQAAHCNAPEQQDERRRAKIIPIIRGEIERREIERSISSTESLGEVGVGVTA